MDKSIFGRPVRHGFDQAYDLAYEIASKKLRETADLGALCLRSGATLADVPSENVISLPYLGRECRVALPAVEVTSLSGDPLSQRDKLLSLHYLNTADGSPLSGKPITFKELPEGLVYYPTYAKRVLKPLLDKFGESPEALIAAAESMGGAKSSTGDFSFTLDAFPRVPLAVTLWVGDEELPAEANILFDDSITDYLPTEDITVLCEILAWKLVKLG